MAQYYEVPQEFANMNLEDIQRKYGGLGGVYSQMFGIPASQRLQAGQTLTYNDVQGINFAGSTEGGVISKYFKPGIAPEQKAAQEKEAQLFDLLQQGKTESIGTLEKGRVPLKQRYDDIIASIKGTAGLRTQQAETATAREYGKRGIPTTSGVYDVALQQARLPIDVALGESLAGVGLQEEQSSQARDFAIAEIQRATSSEQVQTAMQLYQIAENARLNGISLEESARQFNENLALQREQFREPTAATQQYTTLGEGSTLFDLLAGKPLYTAPKTYKGTSGGGFDESGWS